MERIKEELNRYKWVLLTGVIVAILIALITANLHVLRFMGYKIQGNETGIISILNSTVKSSNGQNEWYFTQGIDYLLKQNKLSDESLTFFEENFERFNDEIKLNILAGYNRQKLLLPTTLELMRSLIGHLDNKDVQEYIKRMDSMELEKGLVLYYGNNPKVTNEFVDELYMILRDYPNKLNFEKFQFNLYSILCLEGKTNEEKKVAIFSKLDSLQAKKSLFDTLKQEMIDGEQLRTWVEFLKKTNIIDDTEYTKFNTMYSEVYLIRNQYKALDKREIELKNNKEAVEVRIADSLKQIETKQAASSVLTNEISEIDGKLGELTNSAYMALYIEKSSGTGANEYIASIPKKGMFGNYKPSDAKYIVKLTGTGFLSPDVYYVDIYLKGTKAISNGNEYPYYVEVSSTNLNDIATYQKQREEKTNAKSILDQEIVTLQTEVDQIKAEMGYDDNQEELKTIVVERQELIKKLNERIVDIKTLFGLGKLNIAIEASSDEKAQGDVEKNPTIVEKSTDDGETEKKPLDSANSDNAN